jgi:Skp family chaperone for outer membrane proteins
MKTILFLYFILVLIATILVFTKEAKVKKCAPVNMKRLWNITIVDDNVVAFTSKKDTVLISLENTGIFTDTNPVAFTNIK